MPQAPRLERVAEGWRGTLPSGEAFTAAALVLTAGSGNAQILESIGHTQPQMQTRPLHMLMLRAVNMPCR